MNSKLYKDFDIFARSLVGSNDHDPIYPVIKDILTHHPKFQPEFFVFVYVAFYNLSTAIEFCSIWPTLADFEYGKTEFLKMRMDKRFREFGHERRGTCRNPVNQLQLFEAAKSFIETDIKKHRLWESDNKKFRQVLQTKPWHGNWASYKIAEVFEKSLGWKNLVIEDLGIDERDPNSNDGPVGGLRWLFGRDNKFSKDWFPIWNRFGEQLSKAYGWDIGIVETVCCKFHKMASGKYYPAHDVDELHELKRILPVKVLKNIFVSNFAGLNEEGITGIKKPLKTHYLKTGEVPNEKFANLFKPVDVEAIILDL